MTRPGPSESGERLDPPSHWFEDYFDSRVLDLYRARTDPSETRTAVEGILDRLGLPVGARLLDVGCGWGRHALLLGQIGIQVVALDRSPEALRQGKREAERLGIHVDWTLGDLRALPFAPGASFDGAVSLGSSLGYFQDPDADSRFLEALRMRMAPGGGFLLETLIRDGFQAFADPFERWDDHRGPPVEVERNYDSRTGVNQERIRWPDGFLKLHWMQLRSSEEWVQKVEEAGFRVDQIWGGWDEDALEPEAPEMVLLARVP